MNIGSVCTGRKGGFTGPTEYNCRNGKQFSKFKITLKIVMNLSLLKFPSSLFECTHFFFAHFGEARRRKPLTINMLVISNCCLGNKALIDFIYMYMEVTYCCCFFFVGTISIDFGKPCLKFLVKGRGFGHVHLRPTQ